MEALQRKTAMKSIKGHLDQKFICLKLTSMLTFHMLVGKISKRVSIHASTFQKHIASFPLVDSDENPPEHTVVIEADIRHAPK